MTTHFAHHLSRTALTPGWTLTAVGNSALSAIRSAIIPATVPGSVHTDLLSAGLIPDPYLDDDERLLAWIGLTDWRYTLTFPWDQSRAERTEIVFEGLDTVAEIELNGHSVASARNMNRSYRFDVSALLKSGLNELAVLFRSPLRYADAASLEIGYLPHVNHHSYNAVQANRCHRS